MCKIWLKSIQPLPLYACVKKRGFAWVFFVYISVYPVFATPTGHIFSAILTLNGSHDVFLQPLVPFGGLDETAPHLGGQIPQKTHFGGLNRRFQDKLVKSKNMHIIKTIASIPTKLCTAIKTTKCSSTAILEKSQNQHISAAVWPISTKFGTETQFNPLQPSNH